MIDNRHTDIKPACGTQVDSRKKTAPSPSFGSSPRSRNVKEGHNTPGPGAYTAPTTIGKPVVSTIRCAPGWSVSGREKFGSTTDLKDAANSPGPGNYCSNIVNPKERKAPQYSLGKRWNQATDLRQSPGPDSYTQPSTMGKTVLSNQCFRGSTKFGTGKRPPLLQTSAAEVGPGQYTTGNTAVGPQAVSTFENSAKYSFSVSGRKKAPIGSRMNHDCVPGPGAYKVKGAVGTQIQSHLKSAPKTSMSGRVKFGSHF